MTQGSDDGDASLDPRFDPAFQRSSEPTARGDAADRRPPLPRVETDASALAPARPRIARWLAPVLWILAVVFPAAGLALRALAVQITTSMPYSSFGRPLGPGGLLELAPLLTVLAPAIAAGGPTAVIAALVVHAVRRPRR